MAYTFGKDSENLIKQCHPLLQRILRRMMAYQVLDMKMISALRTPAQQAEKVAQGVSKTTASKHLPDKDGFSRAADVAPFPIDWKDKKRFGMLMCLMCVAAQEEFGRPWREVIRLGGNWDGDNDFADNTPEDPGHVELVPKFVENFKP